MWHAAFWIRLFSSLCRACNFDFLAFRPVQWPTQSPDQWVLVTLSSGLKQQVCEIWPLTSTSRWA